MGDVVFFLLSHEDSEGNKRSGMEQILDSICCHTRSLAKRRGWGNCSMGRSHRTAPVPSADVLLRLPPCPVLFYEGGDMQAGNSCAALVVRKDKEIAAVRVHCGVVRGGHPVFAASLVRTVNGMNGVLCSSSRMRGIIFVFCRTGRFSSRR